MKIFIIKGKGFTIPGYAKRVICKTNVVSSAFIPDRYILRNLKDLKNKNKDEIAILLQSETDIRIFETNYDVSDEKVFYSKNDFESLVSKTISEINKEEKVSDENNNLILAENENLKAKIKEYDEATIKASEYIAGLKNQIKELEDKNASMKDLFGSICRKFNIYKDQNGELVQLTEDMKNEANIVKPEETNKSEEETAVAEEEVKPRRGRRKKEEA